VAGGQPEEGRYISLRASWGDRAPLYFLFFFEAQGILNVVLSLPFLLIALNSKSTLSPLEFAGAGLWLFAVNGEALADRQLKAFKADRLRKERVCRRGLWKYSRHPNYFFEWLIWCAYALMALSAPWGWLGCLSPLIILFLLLKVSGIPPTEKQALKSRGEEYRRYQATTSAFVPWFPKPETLQ
jgi:steroid 5-alpha reductase family enzyme